MMGQEFSVEQLLPDCNIQLKNVATNEGKQITQDGLTDALFDGRAELLGDGDGADRELNKSRLAFEELSLLDDADPKKKAVLEKLKNDAKRRYKYAIEIRRRGITTFTENSLRPIREGYSSEINDLSPPSCSSLRRWYALLTSGEDVRVFIALQHKQGNRRRKFGYKDKRIYPVKESRKFKAVDERKAKDVAQIALEIINDEYLSEERPSVETVYDSIEARIRLKNSRRDEDDKLPIPARSSIYEMINKIPEYERDKARYGKRFADRKHKAVKQGIRPIRPLERVEMDDTKVDLFIIDPERGLPIGRPTIFSNIDVQSWMPLGTYSSFNSPSYLSVMQCLLHSIKKKSYVSQRYPEVKNEWRCYGIPETLVVDNAKQYWSESLEDAALELNMIVEYSPVRMPWYKACIERFFGTVVRELLHHQPGTTFSNIFDRCDYDPKKHAIVSYETFLKILHIFLIDIYSQEEHSFDGFPDIPARRWDEGVKDFPPTLPSKVSDLRVLIGQVEWRVISPNGIELFGLHYNCEELISLRDCLKGQKAKIKIDPEDISICYAADPRNRCYIPVPAKNRQYTKGLTLFQHDVIRRYARQMVKKYVDAEALCRAKELIKEIVWQEWKKAKPNDTGVRMARFMNYGWELRDDRTDTNSKNPINGERHSSSASPMDELPRLNPSADSVCGESDLGSAFPSPSVPSDHLASNTDQSDYRIVESDVGSKNGDSPARDQASTPQHDRNEAGAPPAGEHDKESSIVASQGSEAILPDREGWGAEYEF